MQVIMGGQMQKYLLPGKDNWHNLEIVGEAYRETQISAALGRQMKLDEEIEETLEALLVPEPDNPHDANAISVRVRGQVVGYLSREAATLYRPIIHRITASGLVATTTSRIWAVTRKSWDEPSKPRFYSNIRIYMPEPHQILPLNVAPQMNVAVLPWGGALQVIGEDKHFDHLFNYLPTNGEGLVILTMHRIVQTLKNGADRDLVEVRLDGERVGQLTAVTSGHFLPTIAHAADFDKELGVWAKIRGSGLAAELVIQGARAADLGDDWLNTMPTFARLVPDAAVYDVPPAFTEAEEAPAQKYNAGSPTRTHSPALPIQKTKGPRGAVSVTDKDRLHSAAVHRLGGAAKIVLGVLVGGLLAAIPAIGPVLFIGCVIWGVMGNIRSRKIAAALEEERRYSQPRQE